MTFALGKRDTLNSERTTPSADRQPNILPQHLTGLARSIVWRTKFLELWIRRGLGLAQPRPVCEADLQQGLTLVLPGIEAESVFTYGICDGLRNGGHAGAITVHNWGLPFPGGYLANLVRVDRNRRQARKLAHRIIMYQRKYPGRPTHLVAHSGGAGIAVFAAEELPENHKIDTLVLLSGALSPTYDLRRALSRTKNGILNSYSPKDRLVLKWGTTLFGTTDRVHGPACGYAGFITPPGAEHDYRRLVQIRWQEKMAKECSHGGGHITSACEEYLTQYICPWLTKKRLKYEV